ncbi:MAG: lipoate--protein ligase family protein [Campylobacterota bacterium]|nr:lipoate--protein ligase family protein [Campylobacterota bacterium]
MFASLTNKKVRLILSLEPLSAKDNMDIDTQLFSSFDKNSIPTLRLYYWKKNSCTIGISQDFSQFINLKKYENNYAKRITGGGVLFHGDDISYSFIIPKHYLNGFSVKKSYEIICSFLLEFYKSLGLDVRYAKDDKNIVLSKSTYCQEGFEPYDIVIKGKKLGGNAQRRTKEVIFQHGSIPLKIDEFNIDLSKTEIQNMLKDRFQKTFNCEYKYE